MSFSMIGSRLEMAVKLGVIYLMGLLTCGAYLAIANAPSATQASLPEQDLIASSTAINIPWLPQMVDRWSHLITKASEHHQIDPELLAIILLVESGGNPAAVSPAGAVGLMQIMPTTAADIAERRGIERYNLLDPETNVSFGAWYLSSLLESFGQNDRLLDWSASVWMAAGAYNSGPGRLAEVRQGKSFLPTEGIDYTYWVSGMWRERHEQTSHTFTQWYDSGGSRLISEAKEWQQ